MFQKYSSEKDSQLWCTNATCKIMIKGYQELRMITSDFFGLAILGKLTNSIRSRAQ